LNTNQKYWSCANWIARNEYPCMNVSFQFSLNNFFHNDAKIIWLTVDYGRPWFDVDVEGLVVGHSEREAKTFF